jgi:hypothetical protein
MFRLWQSRLLTIRCDCPLKGVMPERDLQSAPSPSEIILRWPPNWTAVIFFATLALLHTCICIPAFFHGRWEGYMSLIFATIFWTLSIVCLKLKARLIILPAEKTIRLRAGLGRFTSERIIPFSDIRGVRLTICSDSPHADSRIELLCPGDDIECPPTDIPREQALYLAMTLNIPLTKAFADGVQDSDRIDQFSND